MASKNNLKRINWTSYMLTGLLFAALILTVLFVHQQQQLQTKATFNQKDLLEITDENGMPLASPQDNVYQLNSDTVRIRVR